MQPRTMRHNTVSLPRSNKSSEHMTMKLLGSRTSVLCERRGAAAWDAEQWRYLPDGLLVKGADSIVQAGLAVLVNGDLP